MSFKRDLGAKMIFTSYLRNMRIKIIRNILIILILLGIFNSNEEINNLDAYQDIPKLIEEAPYSVSDYKEDIFDCSNMCALLNDYLRNQGVNCSILVVNTGVSVDHCFLKCGNDYIETTEKRILSPIEKERYKTYPIKVKYDGYSNSLKEEWKEYFGEEIANKEWSY
jgi:hypothetical protein